MAGPVGRQDGTTAEVVRQFPLAKCLRRLAPPPPELPYQHSLLRRPPMPHSRGLEVGHSPPAVVAWLGEVHCWPWRDLWAGE